MASVAAGTRGGVTNSPGSGGSSGLGDGNRVGGGTGLGGGYRSPNPNRFGPRYERKKTRSFAPTMSNLAQVAGTVLGALAGPVGTALNAGASAIAGVNPLDPFERPTGMVDTHSYDPINRALGQESPMTARTSATKRITRPKKKMVGYTLLEGAGGVLSGS